MFVHTEFSSLMSKKTKNYKIRLKSQTKPSQVKVQNADSHSSLWTGLFALIKQCLSEKLRWWAGFEG